MARWDWASFKVVHGPPPRPHLKDVDETGCCLCCGFRSRKVSSCVYALHKAIHLRHPSTESDETRL